MKQEVLVVGVSHPQGSAVAHALLQAGYGVRVLTPNLADRAAESLRLRGARLAWAELDDRARLGEAVEGTNALFLLTTAEHGAAKETAQGLALLDLAQRNGVQHVVFSSQMAAAGLTGIPHYDSKHEIEQYLRATGVPWTIICPGFLMESLLEDPWLAALRRGIVALPLAPRRRLQHIAVADIARFVCLVLRRPEEFLGRRVCLASDETTGIEMAAGLARVIGRRFSVGAPAADTDLPEPWTREAFAWLDEHPGCANVSLLRARYPEVNWHTLDGWARRQDWSALNP